jgi:hypothetical protein
VRAADEAVARADGEEDLRRRGNQRHDAPRGGRDADAVAEVVHAGAGARLRRSAGGEREDGEDGARPETHDRHPW